MPVATRRRVELDAVRSLTSELWALVLADAPLRTSSTARAVERSALEATNVDRTLHVVELAGRHKSLLYRVSLLKCVHRDYNMACTSLCVLHLEVSGLGAHVNVLGAMPHVKRLILSKCDLEDKHLAMFLSRVPNLEMLTVVSDEVGPLTVGELSGRTGADGERARLSEAYFMRCVHRERMTVFGLLYALLHRCDATVIEYAPRCELNSTQLKYISQALEVGIAQSTLCLSEAVLCGRLVSGVDNDAFDASLLQLAHEDACARYATFVETERGSLEAEIAALTLERVRELMATRRPNAKARVVCPSPKPSPKPSPPAKTLLPMDRNERRKLLLPTDKTCQACGVVWRAGSVTISQCETIRSQCKVWGRTCSSRQEHMGLV